MNKLGIVNRQILDAALATNTDIVLGTITGMTFDVIAAQQAFAKFWLPFTLGATGGFRFNFVVPAAFTSFLATYAVIDTVTANTLFSDVQVTNAADFTNASAVAGEYILQITLSLTNGVNAGAVALQFAQNNSTANNITMLRGGYGEVVLF
jgi:hypothetical protein